MKKNIIIIGKKGFISSNLFLNLRYKQNLKIFDYQKFLNLKESYIKKFDYVINCSINKEYIKNKYSQANDFNFMIAKKIESLTTKMIFLCTNLILNFKFFIG